MGAAWRHRGSDSGRWLEAFLLGRGSNWLGSMCSCWWGVRCLCWCTSGPGAAGCGPMPATVVSCGGGGGGWARRIVSVGQSSAAAALLCLQRLCGLTAMEVCAALCLCLHVWWHACTYVHCDAVEGDKWAACATGKQEQGRKGAHAESAAGTKHCSSRQHGSSRWSRPCSPFA